MLVLNVECFLFGQSCAEQLLSLNLLSKYLSRKHILLQNSKYVCMYVCLWPHMVRHLPVERVTAAAADRRPSVATNAPRSNCRFYWQLHDAPLSLH